jgi:hypothetical protein
MVEAGFASSRHLRAGILKFRKREFPVLSFPSSCPESLGELMAAELRWSRGHKDGPFHQHRVRQR